MFSSLLARSCPDIIQTFVILESLPKYIHIPGKQQFGASEEYSNDQGQSQLEVRSEKCRKALVVT
jgi:hypothetical protein